MKDLIKKLVGEKISELISAHKGAAIGVGIALASIIGALATGFVTVRAGNAEIAYKQHEQKVNGYEYLIDKLEAQVRHLELKVDNAEETINRQELEIAIAKESHYRIALPVWVKDRDGRYLDWNEAFEHLIFIPAGIDPDTAAYKTDFQLFGTSAITLEWREKDKQVMQERKLFRSIEYLRERDGQVTEWRTYKTPYYERHRVSGTVGVAVRNKPAWAEQVKENK